MVNKYLFLSAFFFNVSLYSSQRDYIRGRQGRVCGSKILYNDIYSHTLEKMFDDDSIKKQVASLSSEEYQALGNMKLLQDTLKITQSTTAEQWSTLFAINFAHYPVAALHIVQERHNPANYYITKFNQKLDELMHEEDINVKQLPEWLTPCFKDYINTVIKQPLQDEGEAQEDLKDLYTLEWHEIIYLSNESIKRFYNVREAFKTQRCLKEHLIKLESYYHKRSCHYTEVEKLLK